MTKPKRLVRFIVVWLFCRPFVFASAFGYWVGSDDLTYWQCIKKMWSEPL